MYKFTNQCIVMSMECPRCRKQEKRVKMKDMKRRGGFHKQTKYICPDCGLIRMKRNK